MSDMYLTAINYLSYDDLMNMSMPMLTALMDVKAKQAANNPTAGMDGLGQLANLVGGRR